MSNDVDRYFDEFGRRLKRANGVGQVPNARLRWRRLGAIGVAAAMAVVLVVALLPGAGKLTPVDSARAAIAISDEILHYRAVETVRGPTGKRNAFTVSYEEWIGLDPVRWRTVSITREWDKLHRKRESAYADGTETTYDPRRRILRQSQTVPPVDKARTDPVGNIRGLLASGALREQGRAELNGRPVLRLVGRRTIQGTTAITDKNPKPRRTQEIIDIAYDVDPETFIPIQMRETYPLPPATDKRFKLAPGSVPTVITWDFPVFERLNPTPENLALLTITPAAGTKVVRDWPVTGPPRPR